MSQSMTFAPACAKAVAIPSPIPDAAPVTNAVFPASSFMRILPVLVAAVASPRSAFLCCKAPAWARGSTKLILLHRYTPRLGYRGGKHEPPERDLESNRLSGQS